MSEPRPIHLILDDMPDAMDAIFDYTREASPLEKFLENRMCFDAVVRNFEVIGEAAAKLPDDFRVLHSEVSFGKMAGMRNRLIHGYFDISASIVFATVATVIPGEYPLLKRLRDTFENAE